MVNNNHNKLLVGCHVSIAAGVQQALYTGAELGCTALQIFTASNRQWALKEFSEQTSNLFKQAQQETSIEHVVSHASYLINLGSSSPLIREKSLQALKQELVRCAQLGIKYLVLHPGAGTLPEQACLDLIIRGINQVFSHNNTPVTLLLENTAGQGTSVGYTLEHLAYLIHKSAVKERLGVCFDTCHAFAAGYSFTTPQEYAVFWNLFDSIIGLDYLRVIHMNDSLRELGSRVDRHEHIGKGKIGLAAFDFIINDTRFVHCPKILETPKTTLTDDIKNIALLKSLYKK